RYRSAADAYERRLRLDDRSAEVRYHLALARYRDGDLDAALAALEQAVVLDDRFSDRHYLMGLCLRDKGRTREAAAAVQKAVAKTPGMVAAREELVDLYRSLDRYDDEIQQLQVLAGLDGGRLERRIAIGLAHARAGHHDLAVLTLANLIDHTTDQPL